MTLGTRLHLTTGRRRWAAASIAAVLLTGAALSYLTVANVGTTTTAAPPPSPRTDDPLLNDPDDLSPGPKGGSPRASAPPAIATPEVALTPVYRIPTTQRVVFLTLDDGITRNPRFLARLLAAHIPVTIFPTALAATAQPTFFTPMLAAGASLGDHTVTHPALAGLSPTGQRNEICAAAAAEHRALGVTPLLFRPPYGSRNQATDSAATACGMSQELLWDAVITNGTVTGYHGPISATNPLAPGDIMLMHFRPTFLTDFTAALTAATRSHLQFAVITHYLNVTRPTPSEQTRQDAALALYPQLGLPMADQGQGKPVPVVPGNSS